MSTWKLSKVLSMQKLFLQLHKVTDNVTPTRSCLFVFNITIYLRKLSSVLLLLGLIENSERTKLNWCFLCQAEVCKKCHSKGEVHSQNANYCDIVFKPLLSFFYYYVWQMSPVFVSVLSRVFQNEYEWITNLFPIINKGFWTCWQNFCS